MRTPWFFKLWFAFIFCAVLAVWGCLGWAAYTVISGGPEMIGRAVGIAASAYNDAARSRTHD